MQSNEDNDERFKLMTEAENCLKELSLQQSAVKKGIPPRISGLPVLVQDEIVRILVDLLEYQNRVCSIYNQALRIGAQDRDKNFEEGTEFFKQRNKLFLVIGELMKVCEQHGLTQEIQSIKNKLRYDLEEGLLLEDLQQHFRNETDEN